jgi:soluble lytic murein transglycosylase-like protein
MEEDRLRSVQESGRVRIGRIFDSRSLVLAAIGVMMTAGSADAMVAQEQEIVIGAVADTSRIQNPVRFRKSLLFSPDYLARIAERASERRTEEERAEARAVREAGAATFAQQYGISNDLARQIFDAALAEGIDPDLAFRLVRVESRFNPRARGPQGALGLAQLMPATARYLDRSLRTEAQILEPSTNLRLGFGYLRYLIGRYDGDVRMGLLAYNRGSGTVDRVLRTGRDPENGYSRKVLGSQAGTTYRGPGLVQRSR